MGLYSRLTALLPKQSCVLCTENAKFCICQECESVFSSHQHRCLSCAHPISGNLDFCGQCLSHSPAFNRAYTLYDYQKELAQLLKSFKYDNQLCIGDYFAYKLYDLYQSIQDYDVIIPMPLSQDRITQRGFNQVLELLRQIKQKTPAVIDLHSVRRVKATKPLSSLGPEQRKQEIKGAFSAQAMNYKKHY